MLKYKGSNYTMISMFVKKTNDTQVRERADKNVDQTGTGHLSGNAFSGGGHWLG